jgi:predicted RNase H-like HicB family nuclease
MDSSMQHTDISELGESIMSVQAILRSGQHGGFWVEVPSLPGCIARGRTRDEAMENVYEAVGRAVEAYRAQGRPVPWQPEPSQLPADGEVITLNAYWDDPPPVLTPERAREIEAERARGEYIDVADILREYGVDVPRRN